MNTIIEPAKNFTESPDPNLFNMHAHDRYEIFCFLSGDAKYFVEGNIYKLKKNDILIIKKAESHSLLIRSVIPYKRITVHFTNDAIYDENSKILEFLNNKPLGKNNRFPTDKCGNTNWIYYLEKMCGTTDYATQRIYLNVLLSELYENADKTDKTPYFRDNTAEIIKYINENLTNIENLDDICNRFFISKTQINRNFKTIVGTTVWKYILTKKLLLAKEFLGSGITPTVACEKSGFSDYCSFFKLYKSQFGTSPKHDYIKTDRT